MINKQPILITGIPRSGTSMIAAAINVCGAFGGRMSRRGMYNNDAIREDIVKPYMERMGADPEGQYNFPMDISIPINWAEKVEEIILSQGYKEGNWMYKDSRSSLIWQTWAHAYPNAKWVIVRRKTPDVINSCMKTGYMNAYATELGWLGMVHEYEKRFVEMITEGLNCKQIWPERMVQGNYDQLREVLDWLDLEWSEQALEYINPLLWSNNKERSKLCQYEQQQQK